jgi:hypothetical protein
MTPHARRAIFGVLICLWLVGCARSERQRPVQTNPIASGPDTVEAARKALEGRWTLLSLDVTAEDGRRATVEATGFLTSDAFGNLHVEYRLSEPGRQALEAIGVQQRDPVISTTGRVVIDTQEHKITYVGADAEKRAFDPDLAARRANPFALERARYYALDAEGVLTLTTRHDNGGDASTSRWKKGP